MSLPASDARPDSTNLITRWWLGVSLVLLATLCLSLQNVFARIAQSVKPLTLLGGLQLGGYIPADADKIQVSLLVLFLRISFVLPILWLMLVAFRRATVGEVRQIVRQGDRSLQLRIVAAGFFLFLSQTSIYFSIANVGPATAVTIFFIYPTVTTLLAWKFFGDRPSLAQWLAIGLIYLGCTWLTFAPVFPQVFPSAAPTAPTLSSPAPSPSTLSSPSTLPSPSSPPLPPPPPKAPPTPTGQAIGIAAAVLSGIVFAIEGVLAQSCFKRVNPATFTGMIFTVEWIFLAIVHFSSRLIFTKELGINNGLVLMGALLSLATLSGYLFNNFGIREIGAASTAIIGSSGPVVTALLVVLIIANPLPSDRLILEKWLAILVVTLGVLLMNLAKLRTRSARN